MTISVAVVGSRDFTDVARIATALAKFHAEYGIKRIVSGGADGADSIGEAWAMSNDIKTTIYLAKWKEGPQTRNGKFGSYNPKAGFDRNTHVVKHSKVVLAFVTDLRTTRGTKDTIVKARAAKKPTFIWDEATQKWFTNTEAVAFVAANKS